MWNSAKRAARYRRWVVIWCLFEMWNSASRRSSTTCRVVIWCLFEMWNSKETVMRRRAKLWFDAYLKCETVHGINVIGDSLLWFDAYLKCETVKSTTKCGEDSCDLMLIWNVKQYLWCALVRPCRCDLMLIWNVKQFLQRKRISWMRCDLMLIWNVKQWYNERWHKASVVIWCLFEMWNSWAKYSSVSTPLWFDAYLKCETVLGRDCPLLSTQIK